MAETNNTKKSSGQSSTVSFFAKYKDPRWQRKRLEIMEASDFKCENCGTNDKTLNVHHKSYKKNHAPWEYENYELECLCEDCHSYRHNIKDRLTSALHDFKTNPNFSERPEEELLGFLEGRLADGPFGVIPTSDEYLRGYCMSYLLDVDEINAGGKLSEIIEAGNGYIEFEMFDWAFSCQEITDMRASYVRKAIAEGLYTHYPAWLLEKIRKLIGLSS
ncbi:MAG: HNH endonuclease signature motif containing protein [Methylovulum sp.]|nr:HNH endonuclease signature motif containing protein [Methylovulum sp.]